jgi:hypothetical protein
VAKDRIVEMTLVVRINRHIDDDLELIIKDALESDGTVEIRELTRLGMTGTIDLPRLWLPTKPDEVPPPPFPPAPEKKPDPPPERRLPPWRKKK